MSTIKQHEPLINRQLTIRLALLASLAVGCAAALWLLPVGSYFTRLLAWLDSLGPWGPLILAAIYVPACAIAAPVSPLTMSAGFVFGLGIGFVAALFGEALGTCAAFLVSRSLARQLIETRLKHNPKFAAIDRAIAHQGFKIIFLMRLSPAIPYNVLNYALGLTGIKFRRYALSTWLGMVPGTFMYVYFGTAMKSLTDIFTGQARGGGIYYTLLVLGLLATMVVSLQLARIASRAINDAARWKPGPAA